MIDVAIDAAKQGGQLALSYFTKIKNVSYKADNSPVTEADKNAEKLIREIISKKFPDHGFIGEEFGETKPNAKYVWVIDPIDGTSQYIRQLPYWSTFVALLKGTEILLGIAYSPQVKEVFVAQKGKGLFLNNKKIVLSKTKDLKLAGMTHGSVNRFENKGQLQNLSKLSKLTRTKDSLGSHNLNLLLKGQADIELEAEGHIWDFAAPAILVEEGGGSYSDFTGKKSINSGHCLLTNGLLHEEVLKLLNS